MQSLSGMKAEYAGMTDNRFRRKRVGISSSGGSGDTHYYSEANFIRMREYVRAMVRDDSNFKFLINRAVINLVGPGFSYEPDTGDEKLNTDLKDSWIDWAKDRRRCDSAGRRTFAEMEKIVVFSDFVDGDVFAAGQDDGAVRLYEADEIRTPTFVRNRRIIHGIELDERRRHQRYWIVKDPVALTPVSSLRLDQFVQIDALDEEGYEQVWQVCDSHRIRMTRGITAAHPIFDKAGKYEDIDFALLVKQQFAAMIAWFLKRDQNYVSDVKTGSRTEIVKSDGTTQTLEEIEPGAFIRGNKGEDLELKAANIPSSETLAHLRHTLQMICLNLSLPYCVGMMDGTGESFSSIRFVYDQAKLGWISTRGRIEGQFHNQAAVFRTRQMLAEDRTMARASQKRGIKVFKHWWQKPAWPYPQPLHDASAAAIRLQTGQLSLIDFHAENGGDFKQFVKDSVKSNGHWIEAAIIATKALKEKYGDDARDVTWRDLYYRDLYKGGQTFDSLDTQNDSGTAPGTPSGKK